MRICSLVPSATEILYALGLEDSIVGVTDICDYPPEAKNKRVVCRCLFDPAQLTSAEVEARMQAILRDRGSPFVLDVDWLSDERPDLIIAQDLCYRCSPDSSEVIDICSAFGRGAKVLTLHPRTLCEIFGSIRQIGSLTGREQEAIDLNTQLGNRIKAVSKKVEEEAGRIPRVFSVEGIDPLVVGGNWLPEMRMLAGGRDDFFTPGRPAQRIGWDLIRKAAPEVLVIALCSSPMVRSVREAVWLTRQEGWSELPAVKKGRVYVAEHVYFSRPGPRIVTGLEILAQLFHPEVFSEMIPEGTVRAFSLDLTQTFMHG
jgi:iron complex transport system substrate-binding protein